MSSSRKGQECQDGGHFEEVKDATSQTTCKKNIKQNVNNASGNCIQLLWCSGSYIEMLNELNLIYTK